MMQDLRAKTKIIMIIVALAFVGLMVFEWGMDISGRSSVGTGILGEVNGDPVTYEAYSAAYQQLYDQASQQQGGSLSAEQVRQVEDAAFEQVVNDILLQQEIERRGIRVTNAEIQEAARWSPHPQLAQQEIFLTNGQFDIVKWQQFLAGPQASEDLLLQLEQYYRSVIPRDKLIRQVTAGMYIPDSDLWRLWRDQNETATVDYVALDVSKLVPGEVSVTDGEIADYYGDHEDEFERPLTARLTIAMIPKIASVDTAAALARAQAIREEIAGGADFATVAERESADQASRASGGDLGTFTRGQMVAAFEEAAFSLPVNELSQPVQTEFGFHIIQVQERTDEQVRARHILIAPGASEAELDALYARADSLEELAADVGIARAARATRASLQQGVTVSEDVPFVPGVGSAFEAVEWAEEESVAEDGETISPLFETEQAFYIAERESVTPAGRVSRAEAAPQIRRLLIAEKKEAQARAIGEEIAAEVNGGKTLEQAATERGLTVETYGPFSRVAANPVFGQASAPVGAAFGTPVGRVSDVVESPAGLFIVRPKEIVAANREEFDTQKAQLRAIAQVQAQQSQGVRFLQALRESADIEDNRKEAFSAQAQQPVIPPIM